MTTLLSRALRTVAGAALGVGLSASLLVQPVVAQASAARPAEPAEPAEPAAAAARGPALWAVRDADSTVYLFGTFHALRPTTQWRTPAVERALAESRELWLEIEDPGDPAALQPLVAQLGLSPGTPLSSRLNEADRAKLAQAATTLQLPPAALEAMRPWLAALTLSVAPLIQAGYDPNRGVDRLLKEAAQQRGMTLRAFETPEQQFRFLADMPEEEQLAFLRQALDEYAEGPREIDALSAAWSAGDLRRLESDMVEEMRRESPSLYRRILADRNTAWTPQIRRLLDGSGTVFVAVGAAHLAGPDSVQAQLERQGLRVERVQ